jgi:hypothetical protein
VKGAREYRGGCGSVHGGHATCPRQSRLSGNSRRYCSRQARPTHRQLFSVLVNNCVYFPMCTSCVKTKRRWYQRGSIASLILHVAYSMHSRHRYKLTRFPYIFAAEDIERKCVSIASFWRHTVKLNHKRKSKISQIGVSPSCLRFLQ